MWWCEKGCGVGKKSMWETGGVKHFEILDKLKRRTRLGIDEFLGEEWKSCNLKNNNNSVGGLRGSL